MADNKKRVMLGVTGGIACYKAADLASRLMKEGVAIDVVMTKNACEFVVPLTFRTITRAPVYVGSFDPIEDWSVEHVSLAKRCDIVLVAPATANIIGKIANGVADDLLTTVLMAAHAKPKLICPAMNTQMWESPALKRNMETLKADGWSICGPVSGILACGDEGAGRLAEPYEILAKVKEMLEI